MKLCLIEDLLVINEAIQWAESVENCQIIALSPLVALGLETMNKHYVTPIKLFPHDDLTDIYEENFDRVNSICSFLDENLLNASNFLLSNNIRPSFYYATYMKWYLNSAKVLTHELTSILKAYPNVHEIRLFSRKSTLKHGEFPSHNLAIHIFKLIFEYADIPNLKLSSFSSENKANSINYRKRLRYILNQALTIKKYLIEKEKHRVDSFEDSMRILFMGCNYSVGFLYKYALRQEFIDVYNWEYCRLRDRDSDLRDHLDEIKLNNELLIIHDLINQDQYFKEFFLFNGYDLWSLFKGYFRHLIKIEFIEFTKEFIRAQLFMKKKRIQALISPHYIGRRGAVGQAAKALKIPVVSWHHGGQGVEVSNQIVEYSDIRPADYWLVWGEEVKRSYENAASRLGCEIIPVGSSQIENEMKSIKTSNATKKKKSRYVLCHLRGMDYPANSDSNLFYHLMVYFNTLKQKLEIFSKCERLHFTFSVHPSNRSHLTLLDILVKRKGIHNVSFKTGFHRLISKCHLIIVDWPYTSLIQAVSSDREMICFTKGWRITDKAEKSLLKRCLLTDELSVLEILLQKYCERGTLNTDVDNKEFLLNYGIFSEDGNANERALSAIREILS